MQTPLQKVTVWPKSLRIIHWILALAVLAQLATGWLMSASPALAAGARDWHYLLLWPLLGALGWRLYLLFAARGVAHWRDCWPGPAQRAKWSELLRFYLSLGRTPLPAWFAHNPLWGPAYLAVFAMFGVQILTGLAIGRLMIEGLSLSGLHSGIATLLAIFSLLHLFAVVLQELGGEGGDISAMLNGSRVFSRRDTDTGGTRSGVQRHDPRG